MKKNNLKNILKNCSLTKCKNIFLGSAMIANIIGISGYATKNPTETIAMLSHPENMIVTDTGQDLEYFEAETYEDIFIIRALYDTSFKVTDKGYEAYCMDYGIPYEKGARYHIGEIILDKGVQHIMFAEPEMGDDCGDYYVRQMAIHHYLTPLDILDYPVVTRGGEYKDKAVALVEEAKKVKNETLTSSNIVNNTLEISQASDKFILDNDYYSTDWFNIGYTGDLKNYSVSVENAPSGIEILNESGNPVLLPATLSNSDTKFKLRVPKNNVLKGYDDIKINVNATFNTKEVVKYLPTDKDDIQRMLVVSETEKVIEKSLSTIINEEKGSLRIIKVNNNDERLQGAEFKLEKDGQIVKDNLVTDSNGEIIINNLSLGSYKLIEKKAPTGYVMTNQSANGIDITIKANEETVQTVRNNIIKGSISVKKIDGESNRPLAGVEFTIYNSENEVVGVYTTDKNGEFKSDKLVYGIYKLKETKVLENYIDNNFELNFEILNDGEVITQIVKNESIKGNLFFQKIDSKTKEVLSGAKMKIVGLDDINKHIEIEFESSKEGNKFILPIGNYEIIELSSPNGYIKSVLPKKIKLSSDEELKVSFENTKIPSTSVDKPQTGDVVTIYPLLALTSIAILIVLNNDKVIKQKNKTKK